MARSPRRWVMAFVVTIGSVASAQAQSTAPPNCTVTPGTGNASDVCQKAADLFAFLTPQVGVALAGGNHVLGEGGTLGGWGKRTISLRVTAVEGRVPQNTVPLTVSRGAAIGDDFGATRVPLPMGSIDAAIGVVTGFPMGLTNVGGVDVLVGAVGYSSVSSSKLDAGPQGTGVAMSYGVRVGALQESSFIPGLSVSWVRRSVPTFDFRYTPANDTLAARNVSLSANTFRLVVSKRFVLLGLAAGVGRDEIAGSAELQGIVNETVLGTAPRSSVTFPALHEKVRRNTAFVNASFGLSIVRFVAEYGRSSAESNHETLNVFGSRQANDPYAYGSLGVTVRF